MGQSPGKPGPEKLSQDRQSETLEDLYRRYSGWLGRALAKQVSCTRPDVEDIVHDTYIRVARYESLHGLDHPKALLLRIGINLARDRARRDNVRARGPEGSSHAVLSPNTIAEADQEQLLLLKQTLLELPLPLREVFVLSRFTGLTYAEIADHLGIAVKTVEWRMSKALAICAAQLRE